MPSMEEPRAKLERANEHLALLKSEIDEFLHQNPRPFEVIRDDRKALASDIEFTLSTARLKVNQYPPMRFGLLFGDFAKDARAALDYLAWQLSLLTRPDLDSLQDDKPPVTQVQFPIFLAEPLGGLISHRYVNLVPNEAREIMDSLQPFASSRRRGNHGWNRTIPGFGRSTGYRIEQSIGRLTP
jgi:hypothetical protein